MKRVLLFAAISLVLTVAGLFWEKEQKRLDAQVEQEGITIDKIFKVKEGMSYSEVRNIFNREGQLLSSKGREGSVNYIEIYRWERAKLKAVVKVTFQAGKASSIELSE